MDDTHKYSRPWLYATLLSTAVALYEGGKALYCLGPPERDYSSLDLVICYAAIYVAWKGLNKISKNSGTLEKKLK